MIVFRAKLHIVDWSFRAAMHTIKLAYMLCTRRCSSILLHVLLDIPDENARLSCAYNTARLQLAPVKAEWLVSKAMELAEFGATFARIDVDFSRAQNWGNLLTMRILAALENFSLVNYSLDNLSLRVRVFTEGRVVNCCLLILTKLRNAHLQDVHVVNVIHGCLIFIVRASQKEGELKICMFWVPKSAQNQVKLIYFDLLFESGKPLNRVARKLKCILDEDIIVLLGVFHLVLLTTFWSAFLSLR